MNGYSLSTNPDVRARALAAELEAEAEIANRSTSVVEAQVVYTSQYLDRDAGFLAPGTIVTIVTGAGSGLAERLLDAIKRGDEREVAHVSADIAATERDGVGQALQSITLERVPAIVDVRYGTSWLARHVFLLEGADAAWSRAVWSGGDLQPALLSARQHLPTGDSPPVTVTLLLNAPRLTTIEKAVLASVPADLSEIHVRGPSVSWTGLLTIGGKYGPEDADQGNAEQGQQEAAQQQAGQQAAQQGAQAQQQQQQQEQGNARQGAQQQQQQQQQADTRQQQQGQQQQERDRGAVQQQQGVQQQQQQEATARQQQQAQQQQQQNPDRQAAQQQQQQQQEIQAETRVRQQQQQQQQRMQAQTRVQQQQQQQAGRPLVDLAHQGYSTLPFDQELYVRALGELDFNAMDATQSVKELLRIRERLLTLGLA